MTKKHLALIIDHLKKVINTYLVEKLFMKLGSYDDARYCHLLFPQNSITDDLNNRLVNGLTAEAANPLEITCFHHLYVIDMIRCVLPFLME